MSWECYRCGCTHEDFYARCPGEQSSACDGSGADAGSSHAERSGDPSVAGDRRVKSLRHTHRGLQCQMRSLAAWMETLDQQIAALEQPNTGT